MNIIFILEMKNGFGNEQFKIYLWGEGECILDLQTLDLDCTFNNLYTSSALLL